LIFLTILIRRVLGEAAQEAAALGMEGGIEVGTAAEKGQGRCLGPSNERCSRYLAHQILNPPHLKF